MRAHCIMNCAVSANELKTDHRTGLAGPLPDAIRSVAQTSQILTHNRQRYRAEGFADQYAKMAKELYRAVTAAYRLLSHASRAVPKRSTDSAALYQ